MIFYKIFFYINCMSILVIVESPAKAKKIQGFLGKDYKVLSSYGHIRALKREMNAIEPDNNFKMNFETIKDKSKLVKDLKLYKKKCKEVIIATDEDREGEAIAWHLMNILSLDIKTTKRIIFNEITKSAILKAIQEPIKLRMNFVNSQFARMSLDHLVGFRLSPLLWNNVKGAVSAGRVQSIILKLIIDKEKEIEDYKQDSFFKISGDFYKDSKDYLIPANIEIEIEDYLDILKKSMNTTFSISSIKIVKKERSPPPPFTTSTLQQEGCKILNVNSSVITKIAQTLYDEGIITYPRTDSVNLSDDFIKNTKSYIEENYGKEFSKMRNYTNKNNSQEAHEAIRPTNLNNLSLNNEYKNKLYKLIWKRAVASQMANENYESIVVEIKNENYKEHFISKIENTVFKGYKILYNVKQDENIIKFYKSLNKDDILKYKEINATEKIKKLPDRYSESTLIKDLEKKGIGRPSTYSSLIETVFKRNYLVKSNIKGKTKSIINYSLIEDNTKIIKEKHDIKLNESKNKMVSTELGRNVNKYLCDNFEKILLNYNFTAELEKNLELVLKDELNYLDLLKNFYKDFYIIYSKLEMENKEKFSIEKKKKTFDSGRLIGNHPETNEPIYVRVAKYGPVAQIGEYKRGKKLLFVKLNDDNLDNVTLEDVLKKMEYPKYLGDYNGRKIHLAERKFGFCICYNDECFSLYQSEKDNLDSIDKDKAIEIIQRKTKKKPLKVLMNGRAEVLEGPYGTYVRYVQNSGKERNISIPKDIDLSNIDDDLINSIINK